MELTNVALICKALGDSNRLEIVQMLSDGEKCGCRLLEKFEITQPTEYSCAAEPPVQYRLSHLSRRSEPLINHTICYDASLLA